MARPPNVRMMPPRKLSVSKCRSSGGALVGGTAVVGRCVVLGTGVVVLGWTVVVWGCGDIVLGWGAAVVVLGCTGTGGDDVVVVVGEGLAVVEELLVVAGVKVVGIGDLVVPVGSSQRATAHSPHNSATATRSLIVCVTWKTGRNDSGVEADVCRDVCHWDGW